MPPWIEAAAAVAATEERVGSEGDVGADGLCWDGAAVWAALGQEPGKGRRSSEICRQNRPRERMEISGKIKKVRSRCLRSGNRAGEATRVPYSMLTDPVLLSPVSAAACGGAPPEEVEGTSSRCRELDAVAVAELTRWDRRMACGSGALPVL